MRHWRTAQVGQPTHYDSTYCGSTYYEGALDEAKTDLDRVMEALQASRVMGGHRRAYEGIGGHRRAEPRWVVHTVRILRVRRVRVRADRVRVMEVAS